VTAFITRKIPAKINRGAKMAHTIKCRLIRLTEMQEPKVSNSWKKQYIFHKYGRPVR
jgi:hypothetical protein